jgi:enoyl-CoA hydratase/carnithine racemase
MTATVLEAGEAFALLGRPDAVGVLSAVPLLAVAVDASPAFEAVVARAGTLPCVTVAVAGTSTTGAPLDVQATSAGEVERLAEAVARSPQASVALVQLLRMGARLDVQPAVVAESVVYGLLQSGREYRSWLAARPAMRHRDDPTPVLLERDGDRLCLTLNRPEVRNAFDAAMRDGLIEGFAVAAADPGIAAVELRGAGPDFCAGGDLSEFGTTPDPLVGHLVRTTRSAALAVAGCARRTTAYLHGACIGAGIELPAFAGRVVAAPGTTITLPEVSMGLVPGAGGTASISRRIGRQRTAWLALLGSPIDAATALDWGLVDEIAPASRVADFGS